VKTAAPQSRSPRPRSHNDRARDAPADPPKDFVYVGQRMVWCAKSITAKSCGTVPPQSRCVVTGQMCKPCAQFDGGGEGVSIVNRRRRTARGCSPPITLDGPRMLLRAQNGMSWIGRQVAQRCVRGSTVCRCRLASCLVRPRPACCTKTYSPTAILRRCAPRTPPFHSRLGTVKSRACRTQERR